MIDKNKPVNTGPFTASDGITIHEHIRIEAMKALIIRGERPDSVLSESLWYAEMMCAKEGPAQQRANPDD
jgi:hypothetical protein